MKVLSTLQTKEVNGASVLGVLFMTPIGGFVGGVTGFCCFFPFGAIPGGLIGSMVGMYMGMDATPTPIYIYVNKDGKEV